MYIPWFSRGKDYCSWSQFSLIKKKCGSMKPASLILTSSFGLLPSLSLSVLFSSLILTCFSHSVSYLACLTLAFVLPVLVMFIPYLSYPGIGCACHSLSYKVFVSASFALLGMVSRLRLPLGSFIAAILSLTHTHSPF